MDWVCSITSYNFSVYMVHFLYKEIRNFFRKDVYIMEKSHIRNEILVRRNAMDDKTVERNSLVIVEKLCKIIMENNFKNIMIFMDMKNEIRITKILDMFSDRKFFIPKTFSGGIMKVTEYEKEKLILHRFGYYESSSEDYADETLIELVVVPGVAFDRNRNRIGFGGGYYDRFLQGLKEKHDRGNQRLPLTVAVCHDFQLLDSIPSEPHDEKPDIILTEMRTLS